MSEILLEVKDAKKHFPLRKPMFSSQPPRVVKAVDGVSFTLMKGEALGLIGESGCGKSTVSRLIMGLYDLTAGQVIYKGKDIKEYSRKDYSKQVQMVFQDPYSSLDPRMCVRRIIEEPLRAHTRMSKAEKLEKVLPLLEKVGLPADCLNKYPHEFSGGQRQRIGLARALITEPDLLICDEPVSALDVSIQSAILNLFKEMQQEMGLSYLFISHDMSVVRHVCDRIAVMYLGQIMELADEKTLFDHTLHPYSIALMSAIPVPDPRHRKERILLAGDPPSPIDPPSGCPFRTRCIHATAACKEQKPLLREVEPGHFVACHLFGKEAAK